MQTLLLKRLNCTTALSTYDDDDVNDVYEYILIDINNIKQYNAGVIGINKYII